MRRIILHSDLNNFYASVECLLHPELREKPVAVVGDAEARHGIVLAKNGIAKRAGIKTGMVIWEAERLAPGLVTVPADFKCYLHFSRKVRKIYESYTDRVEPFGIDECWLDVTESERLFGSGEAVAEDIRRRVREELGLTVSVGVSWNKIFAKIGSDLNKPDAVTVITPENYRALVWPLPSDDLLYVGRATKQKLRALNIKTIGDIVRADEGVLVTRLGKWGAYLHRFASGRDTSSVAKSGECPPVKTVGNSLTNYKDMRTDEEVKILLYLLTESVVARCRETGIYKVKTVHLSIRDASLAFCTRQCKLPLPSLLTEEIADAAFRLFQRSYDWRQPVRGLGVAVGDFVPRAGEQLDLVRSEAEYRKRERLAVAVEEIRERYGNRMVQRGVVLKDKRLAEQDIKEDHVIHPENFFGK